MSFLNRFGKERTGAGATAEFDGLAESELNQALKNFRESVLAWSEAELSRTRTATNVVRHKGWRLAAGWALGCALMTSAVAGGVYEHLSRLAIERDRLAKQHLMERQLLAAAQQARETEEDLLLAKVDSDVSREVPSAMEPLAQLMAEGGGR